MKNIAIHFIPHRVSQEKIKDYCEIHSHMCAALNRLTSQLACFKMTQMTAHVIYFIGRAYPTPKKRSSFMLRT